MRNPWRVTLFLFVLTGVVESTAFGHFGAFTPLFLEQLAVPPAQIPTWTGLFGALGFVLGIPLLPFWAVWADRYGRKLIIARSAYVEAVMFVIAALSVNVWMLAFARFLTGFVLGNTGVMLAAQAETTPRARLGTAIALISAGPVLGQALGPALGGQLVESLGIRTLLGIDAALTALMALVLTLVLREERRPTTNHGSVWSSIRGAGRAIVGHSLVVRLFVIDFLVVMGVTMIGPFVPLRIGQLYQGEHLASTIGWVLTTTGLAMAITTALWGRLSDRIGFLPVLRFTVFAVGAALVGQAVSSSLWGFSGWRLAQGLVQGGTSATIIALIALRVSEDRRASVLNFSRLPAQFAWFLGPLAGTAAATLGIRAVFVGGACFLAAAASLVLILGRSAVAVEQAV